MTAVLTPTDLAFRVVDSRALAAACTWVAKRLPTKPTPPILGGVLLGVTDGRLTVSGFDYDIATTGTLDVTADQDGQVLVSARLLAALTATLPNLPVDIAAVGGRVTVTCGKVNFTLPTMPVEDYPQLPEQPPAIGTVNAVAFATAIDQVAVAADRDGSQNVPALTGVLLRFAPDQITVSATDGYRAAVTRIGWTPGGPNVDAETLVPAAALSDAAKVFGTQGGDVSIGIGSDGTLVGLSGKASGMVSRLLDIERAPARNISRVLPPRSQTPARVSVAELIVALKRADLVRAPKSSVALAFDADGCVAVSASGNDDSTTTGEELDCEYEGSAMTIRCNPVYLLEALSALRSPVAELSMTSERKPVLLTPVEGDYQHLVMPIRPS